MKENFPPKEEQLMGNPETEQLLKNQEEIRALDLAPGDILISASGTKRKIISIEYDTNFPGGGWIQVDTFRKGKPTSVNTLTFEHLLVKKEAIAKVDRIEREQRGEKREN